jgi:hypothetical protein
MKWTNCTFNADPNERAVASHLLYQQPDLIDQIDIIGGGSSQSLYRGSTFIDRLHSLGDGMTQILFGFGRPFWKKFEGDLESQKKSLKALQEGVVQFPRDASPLSNSLLEAYVISTG